MTLQISPNTSHWCYLSAWLKEREIQIFFPLNPHQLPKLHKRKYINDPSWDRVWGVENQPTHPPCSITAWWSRPALKPWSMHSHLLPLSVPLTVGQTARNSWAKFNWLDFGQDLRSKRKLQRFIPLWKNLPHCCSASDPWTWSHVWMHHRYCPVNTSKPWDEVLSEAKNPLVWVLPAL